MKTVVPCLLGALLGALLVQRCFEDGTFYIMYYDYEWEMNRLVYHERGSLKLPDFIWLQAYIFSGFYRNWFGGRPPPKTIPPQMTYTSDEALWDF